LYRSFKNILTTYPIIFYESSKNPIQLLDFDGKGTEANVFGLFFRGFLSFLSFRWIFSLVFSGGRGGRSDAMSGVVGFNVCGSFRWKGDGVGGCSTAGFFFFELELKLDFV